MKHEIRNTNDLLEGCVINTTPPKCETCENDAKGANCVKLILAGGKHICVEKDREITTSNNQ